MAKSDDIARLPLPKGWPKLAKRVLVLVNSLLKVSFDIELGRRLDCASHHAREHAEHERLRLHRDSDREELRLISARLGRLDPNRRPHFTKSERFRILELKAINGWSAAQTARRFILDEKTVCRWMRELAEVGEEKLLSIEPPVNKFPDFVDRIITRMVVQVPQPTKRKIAACLARAGLHISASAVYDRIKAPSGSDPDAAIGEEPPVSDQAESSRTVAAYYPNHVWNVDLTVVPIRGGLWSPLLPFALPQIWPFCWWIAATVDVFSRKAMGFATFKRPPTSRQMQEFLERAFDAIGVKPKYLVTDRGKQFDCPAFAETWCDRHGIALRFGAVGKYGSIAVIERFNRTLKYEGLFLITIPFGLDAMRKEIQLIVEHYNRGCPPFSLKLRGPDADIGGVPGKRRRPLMATATHDVQAGRAAIMERVARKLDRYLPESGKLRKWTISEIEDALIEDMNEIARDIIHARLDVDPDRVVKKARCPDCGRALMGVAGERSTHKHTRLGPIGFARTVGYCRPCGAAFSPSGQRVELRQGLL